MDGETRWLPIWGGRVAHRAVTGYVQCHVRWVLALVEIGLVAARTSIGRVGIIPANMASRTIIGYRNMRPRERPNSIVVKSGGHPSSFRVASGTVGGELVHLVVRVARSIKVGLVASCTSVWRIVVIAVVAGRTVVCNRCVSAI